MRKLTAVLLPLLVALPAAWQPLCAAEQSAVRLIPLQQVTLLKDGKPAQQFKSEVPLPEGLTLASSGKCLLQTNGLQLMAYDKTVFAVQQADRQWDLSLKTGRIDFTLRADTKPIAFRTPHKLLQTQPALVPASTDGLIKGYVKVAADRTEFVVEQGALRVSTSQGTQLLRNGQSIVLAQAGGVPAPTIPPVVGGTTGGITAGVIAGSTATAGIATSSVLFGTGVVGGAGGGGEVSPF